MSKRSMRDYIHDAFFARDKASLAAIVADAEAAKKDDPGEGEPDGDEGKQAIVIHNHHNAGPGDKAGTRDEDKDDDDDKDDFKKKTEDALKELRDGMAKLTDMMTSRAKDEFPPKKDDDDDDKKDDDDKDDTKDANGDPTIGEGAMTGTDPGSAEPDLMEADPALKTGPSMMGDSTYTARVNQAMNTLVRDTKARAEILAPGIKIGVLDGAAGANRMKDAGARICGLRRQALTTALSSERGQVAVGRHTADSLKTMSCDAVRIIFIDASDRMRAMNNSANMPSPQFGTNRRSTNDSLRSKIENLNKRNAEFWAANGGVGRRAS